MSLAAEEKQFRFDGVKWLVIALLATITIVGNYYFAEYPLLYRVAAMIAAAVVVAFLAVQTSKGWAFWELLKGAKNEARRVVWPTAQERNQTTLIVLLVVLVMSLILWGLDSLFSWLAVLIIG